MIVRGRARGATTTRARVTRNGVATRAGSRAGARALVAVAIAAAATTTTPGCAMLAITGYAVEGFAAATQVAPELGLSPSLDDNEGTGLTFGVTLALDVDFMRSSNFGMGLALAYTRLPDNDAGEAVSSMGPASQFWFGGASNLGTDTFRLRANMGLLFGQGESGILNAYAGGGFSLHPSQGTALHLYVGPHWMAVRAPGDGTSFSGLGAFVRVRFRQAFFTRCDAPPSAFAGQMPTAVRCPGM